jgi:hypothetical protein
METPCELIRTVSRLSRIAHRPFLCTTSFSEFSSGLCGFLPWFRGTSVEAYLGKLRRSRILPKDTYNKFNVVKYSYRRTRSSGFGSEV